MFHDINTFAADRSKSQLYNYQLVIEVRAWWYAKSDNLRGGVRMDTASISIGDMCATVNHDAATLNVKYFSFLHASDAGYGLFRLDVRFV